MDDIEQLLLGILLLLLVVRVLKSVSEARAAVPGSVSVRAFFDSTPVQLADALALLKDVPPLQSNDDDDDDDDDKRPDATTDDETTRSTERRPITTDAIERANVALHAKGGVPPKSKRLLVTGLFFAYGAAAATCWWYVASPMRDRIVATRTSRTTMREECSEIESRRRRTMEESEGKDVVVYAHFVRKQGPAATETARNIQGKFGEWVLRSFDRGAETKSDVGVKVTFRGCVDVIDREAFEGTTKAQNEESVREEALKSFAACDKGRSEVARRSRFYPSSTGARVNENDIKSASGMYAHVENELGMNYATYPNEIYAYIFDDDIDGEDGVEANFQLHFGTERNAFVDAKWTSPQWSRGGDVMRKIRQTVQKLYSSAWKVAREDAKFDGHFGASAASLSFALVIPDDDDGRENRPENAGETLSWNFRKDVREPFLLNLSKRLEHFMRIEAESRVMYHHRKRNERNNSLMSTSRRTRQEVIEAFTRALPLRKIDMDAIPSMPSGKFIVYRKNAIGRGDSDDDDTLLPRNWFAKQDNVGVTIWEHYSGIHDKKEINVTEILPFLFANVRARLLGVDIASDETYAKCALPDAVNIFSMMEVDALRSTRVHADMLETVEILCGSMDIGDIDAKDASNLASNLQESFAIVRDALLMENSRQKFELVAKARKLAFQTSRDSINVREEGTFPFEHELALGMPLILPSLVAFVVRFARECVRYSARRQCAKATFLHDKKKQ